MGDVSVMQGTLPLILEAPHGGRIWHGWPARVSGVMTSDQNNGFVHRGVMGRSSRSSGRLLMLLRGFEKRKWMIVDVSILQLFQ